MAAPVILFAVNPDAEFEEPRLGDIKAHKKILKKENTVLWNLIRRFRIHTPLPNYYSRIRKGYIYHVPDKNVSWEVDLEWVKRSVDVPKKDHRYLPSWRERGIVGHESDWITLKIKKFRRLDKSLWLKCSNFVLFSSAKKLKRDFIRNYEIVEEI